jgi:hypothetical protein
MTALAFSTLICGCATAMDDGFPGNTEDEVQEGEGGAGGSGFGGDPGVINATVTVTSTTHGATVTSTVTSSATTTGGDPGCDTGSCDSCQQCALNGVCSGQVDACFANPECSALLDCLSSCVDEICMNDCVNAHPGGIDQYNAVGECIFCTACPLTCGC